MFPAEPSDWIQLYLQTKLFPLSPDFFLPSSNWLTPVRTMKIVLTPIWLIINTSPTLWVLCIHMLVQRTQTQKENWIEDTLKSLKRTTYLGLQERVGLGVMGNRRWASLGKTAWGCEGTVWSCRGSKWRTCSLMGLPWGGWWTPQPNAASMSYTRRGRRWREMEGCWRW